MSSVPMPRDLSEEAVAEWLYVNSDPFNESRVPWGGLYDGERNKWRFLARAVRAMVSAKVREAAGLACRSPYSNTRSIVDYVVSRVMGDHPQGGHDEGRPARDEAPRG